VRPGGGEAVAEALGRRAAVDEEEAEAGVGECAPRSRLEGLDPSRIRIVCVEVVRLRHGMADEEMGGGRWGFGGSSRFGRHNTLVRLERSLDFGAQLLTLPFWVKVATILY
jgi:hypothetical protein